MLFILPKDIFNSSYDELKSQIYEIDDINVEILKKPVTLSKLTIAKKRITLKISEFDYNKHKKSNYYNVLSKILKMDIMKQDNFKTMRGFFDENGDSTIYVTNKNNSLQINYSLENIISNNLECN